MMSKKKSVEERFFVSKQNFTSKLVKIVKNSRFLNDFC